MNLSPLLVLFLSVSDNNKVDVVKVQPDSNVTTEDGNNFKIDVRTASASSENTATTDLNVPSFNLFLINDQLYYNIISGDYNNAVMLSFILEQNNNGNSIATVVNRLLHNGAKNIIEYAYKLWNYGGNGIVTKYFPKQFKHILNGDSVKFENERDGLAVKLDANTDRDGDRRAWGDGSDKKNKRLAWKIISIWEENKVYFKFLNLDRNQYLKLEIAQDSVGDRKGFGSNDADTDRHQWYLQPVKYHNDVLFYIFNRKYNQALILGRWLDDIGDRILWGNSDDVVGNPAHYGWHIEAIES